MRKWLIRVFAVTVLALMAIALYLGLWHILLAAIDLVTGGQPLLGD